MQPLDHHVEQVAVGQIDPVPRPQQGGEPMLVPVLRLPEGDQEVLVQGVRLELLEALQVGDPAGTDRVGDHVGELRVGHLDEAARGDTVGHVGEPLRPQRGEVRQHLVAQQLTVQLGDTVDLGRGDGGEVGHPDAPVGVLGDDRHPAGAQLVARERLADLGQEVLVDAVDDLQVARQQAAEQVGRPHLEGLREQRVAGVGEAPVGDLPGLLPLEAALVHQDAHQLRHRDHRVGVVELEDDPVRQVVEVEVLLQLVVDEVAQRAGHEEVLLLQSQLLALRGGVLGVEHLGDVLGEGLGPHRLGVVTGIEDRQVEGLRRLRAPQPQRVDPAVEVAGDHVVVRHAQHVPGGHPGGPFPAVLVDGPLGVTAEVHLHRLLGVRELPRRAEREPGVGLLDLTAVHEGLAEDAVLVADAVADAGHVHRRQRVDEAGGEPPEATVAEAGLHLLAAQGGQIDAALLEALLGDLVQVGGHQGVAELAAEQVLRGEIADRLGLGLVRLAARLQPAGHQVLADGAGQCQVLVVDAGMRQLHALRRVQLTEEGRDEAVHRMRRRLDRGQGERMRGRAGRALLAVGRRGRLVGRGGAAAGRLLRVVWHGPQHTGCDLATASRGAVPGCCPAVESCPPGAAREIAHLRCGRWASGRSSARCSQPGVLSPGGPRPRSRPGTAGGRGRRRPPPCASA
ncbi:hypothetical protein SDC9_80645 [bioreactor metagenome]|uniref:Uncharacterized protein n=1 Tax=bioreactor metagenome TaxID=1076179 RepID=A0A644Z7J9_9ZZZZ